jgi:hypothetical protein
MDYLGRGGLCAVWCCALLRALLPNARISKALNSLDFIAACLTARLVKEQADHIGLRLLMEGSMSGLVLVAWLWGVFTLGAHAMVTQQSLPSDGENLPGYLVTCSGAHSPPEGARSVGSGDGGGCLRESAPA